MIIIWRLLLAVVMSGEAVVFISTDFSGDSRNFSRFPLYLFAWDKIRNTTGTFVPFSAVRIFSGTNYSDEFFQIFRQQFPRLFLFVNCW